MNDEELSKKLCDICKISYVDFSKRENRLQLMQIRVSKYEDNPFKLSTLVIGHFYPKGRIVSADNFIEATIEYLQTTDEDYKDTAIENIRKAIWWQDARTNNN